MDIVADMFVFDIAKIGINKSLYKTDYRSGSSAGSRKLEAICFETEEITINY